MWAAQELDEEWLAIATRPASAQRLVPPSEPLPSSEPEWADEFEWASEPPGHLALGAGFAEGGLLDCLAPGPALAGFAQNAWADRGLGALSDDSLIGVLRAWRRLASWAAAGELAAVAELDRRRNAEVEAGADPHLAEHVGDELAASLTLTTRGADALLDIACGLARLPLTRAALATGQIDRMKALVITEGVAELGDAHAAAVEVAVIGRAPGQTTGQLRAATRRAVLAVDPTAAKRRQEEARKDARVEVWDEPCGTAALAGRDLPPADVLAADKRIDALARQLKSAGRPESLSELRAQVYLGLLLGVPAGGFFPEEPSGPTATVAGHQEGSAASGPGGGRGAGAFLARLAHAGTGPAGSINLTMPLATWLGGSSEPGEAAGFGPLPADDARALADLIARQPGAHLCLTLTGRDGRAMAHGCARKGPQLAGQDDLRREESWSSRDGPAGQESSARQESWARREVLAAHAKPDNRAGPADSLPARAGPADSRALTVTVRPLAVGECFHGRESKGYRPAASLRHLVSIRQRTCGFPGCRNPAARCDQDHTIPHDQGGRTCECNLASLCRRHHQAKQAQGWRLDQPEPGVLVWRLPHGRSYQVEAWRYPG